MSKYLLTLAVLLPVGAAAQDEMAEKVRRQMETLELVQLAKTDRSAALSVFSGVREAAAQILDDPRNHERLPDAGAIYFNHAAAVIAGEFGLVPDDTRDLIAEAFVQLAIAQPDKHWHQHVVEAGQAGYERVDEALFEIYSAQHERGFVWSSVVLLSYADRPPEDALPFLARIVAQQNDDVGAMTAIEVMAGAGQAGADAIHELERAGTVNDYVMHAVRWGIDGTDDVCPNAPAFMPCVQNEILGNPVGVVDFTCRAYGRRSRPKNTRILRAGCATMTISTYPASRSRCRATRASVGSRPLAHSCMPTYHRGVVPRGRAATPPAPPRR